MLISKWNKELLERVDVPADIKEELTDTKKQLEAAELAFTFRKVQGVNELSTSYSEVIIESEALQKLIGDITELGDNEGKVLQLVSPFESLVYKWAEAKVEANKVDEADSEARRTARQDLQELLKIISTSSGLEQLDKYLKDFDSIKKDKSITHEALWTLFPPGTLIVARPFLGEPQIFFVVSCELFPETGSKEPFELKCYCFDWDGSYFNRVPFLLKIEHFEAKKSIFELACCPLEYYQEEGKDQKEAVAALRQRLIKRGKKYREICIAERGKQMFHYEGSAYHQKTNGFFSSRSSSDDASQSDSGSVREARRSSSESGKLEVRFPKPIVTSLLICVFEDRSRE